MYDPHRINQSHSIIFIHVQNLRSLRLQDFTKHLQGLNQVGGQRGDGQRGRKEGTSRTQRGDGTQRAQRGDAQRGDARKEGTSMILCFYRQNAENFKEKHKIIDVPFFPPFFPRPFFSPFFPFWEYLYFLEGPFWGQNGPSKS